MYFVPSVPQPPGAFVRFDIDLCTQPIARTALNELNLASPRLQLGHIGPQIRDFVGAGYPGACYRPGVRKSGVTAGKPRVEGTWLDLAVA